MKIIAVDDEALLLERLTESIKEVLGQCDLESFQDSEEAVKYCKKNHVDVVFCDINMRGLNGLDMAREILKINPDVDIVFTTGYSEYSLEAWDINASAYLMKPINAMKIQKAVAHLRNADISSVKTSIVASCFGNFEVYAENVPMKFRYSKTKELLAYLISKDGAMCSKDEIIVNLWEDDDKSDYYRKIKKDLVDAFTSYGREDIIVTQRGYIGIIPDEIDCDYYKYKKGLIDESIYSGQFMMQYSWAEPINAQIYGKL